MSHWMPVLLAAVLAAGPSSPGALPAARSAAAVREGGGANTVTIAFTGDTLIHIPVSARAAVAQQSYDFRPMFSAIRPVISSADLAICHLEVPLSADNSEISGYPNFAAPGDLAQGLAFAGFDGCSTASNHSYDRGKAGVIETVGALRAAGLAQAGMATAPTGGWEATYYEVGDLIIAHISATYWLNGYRLPEDSPWLVQDLNADQILGIAARAKRSGAGLVVVSSHCCVEYLTEPTPYQTELNHTLIRSPDVDLVVGHHSHVVGPVEELDGEYILNGLGNLVSAQRGGGTEDGLIALVEVTGDDEGWHISGLSTVATWVEPGSYRILPAILNRPDSYARTMTTVRSYGVAVPHGVWPGFPGFHLPEA